MKILVAGGGTGGHISPALGVISALKRANPNAHILFVCSGKPEETGLLEQNGIDYRTISAGKFRRYGRGAWGELTDVVTQSKNARDSAKVARGYWQARKIIRDFKPDAVFIKGGYVGVPVGLAAARASLPVVIHESDIVMGQANKFLGKYASKIAVSFPVDCFPASLQSKLVLTGNPVREVYDQASQKPTPVKQSKQKPNILLFGGSQGAADLNQLVFENIELITRQAQLKHVTGERGVEQARVVRHRLSGEAQKSYEVHSSLGEQIFDAYVWADVVVARAGMNSLCELMALSKPAVIVPLPTSTNNHQLKNARYFASAGAIRMIEQKDLTVLKLMSEITSISEDPEVATYLGQTLHKFFVPDAAGRVAKLVSESAGAGESEERE